MSKTRLPRVYLDTNIISGIAQDPESSKVLEAMRASYSCRTSLLTAIELGCIEDSSLRSRRLGILGRVTNANRTRPFDDPRTLILRQAASFARCSDGVDPFVNPSEDGKRVVWEALKNPQSLNETQSRLLLTVKQQSENWLHAMMPNLRAQFQAQLNQAGVSRLSLTRFIRMFRRDEAYLRDTVASILQTAGLKKTLNGRELDLIRSHNVWPYFLTALGVGIYRMAVQSSNYSPRRNPGGVDTWQCVYLAFSDAFVTDDRPFRSLLKVVKRYAVVPHNPVIWSYSDLRSSLDL